MQVGLCVGLIHLVMASSASHVYGWFIQSDGLQSGIGKPRASSLPAPLFMAPTGGKHSNNDPTKAIKQAIEVTKTYGATSYKARIAWEVVEKFEYSNRRRPKQMEKKSDLSGSDGTTKQESQQIYIIDDSTFDAVENNVRDLKSLLDEEMSKIKNLKTMANEIKEVKKKSMATQRSKSIEAISTAQEAIKEHGINSPQTALAWKAFEDIVSDTLAP